MKELKIELTKTPQGYSITNAQTQGLDYFPDSNEGRKQLVEFLVNNVLNLELDGGREYN